MRWVVIKVLFSVYKAPRVHSDRRSCGRAGLSKPNVSKKYVYWSTAKNEEKVAYFEASKSGHISAHIHPFGICKNLKQTSCHNLGSGNLPNHRQEPPVLQNSNWKKTGQKWDFLISQLKRHFLSCFKSWKSSPALGHPCRPLRNPVRNLLSSTTPSGRQEDTPLLDILRGISGRRQENKSC